MNIYFFLFILMVFFLCYLSTGSWLVKKGLFTQHTNLGKISFLLFWLVPIAFIVAYFITIYSAISILEFGETLKRGMRHA